MKSANGGDRISNLLDEIIHYIWSFLRTIDVVRASVVSRKWRCLWLSLPFLNLDSNHFGYADLCPNDLDEDVWDQKMELMDHKFKDFVNWVLMSRNRSIDIQRFRLDLTSTWTNFDVIDDQSLYRWISVVTMRNVQEFELVSLQTYKLDPSDLIYKLPYCLVTCESLVKLKLEFSRDDVLQLPTYTGFSRLKSLTLGRLLLPDYILFRNFISSCPVLENLDMRLCVLIDSKILDISSASLKKLTIDNLQYCDYLDPSDYDYDEVKVACSNLVSFTSDAYSALTFSFECVNSLENVFISCSQLSEDETDGECYRVMCKILKGICNAKVLKLSSYLSKLLCLTLDEPECFPTSFYNLKSLVLHVGGSDWVMQSIINLLEYTPNLEALTMFLEEREPTDRWEVMDKAITCLTYHLKVVQLLNANGNEIELELMRFLLSNGHVLQKMSIGWRKSVESRTTIITKLVNFPRASSNVTLKFLEPTAQAIDKYKYWYKVWLRS